MASDATGKSAYNQPFRGLSPFSRRFRDMLDDMAWRLARLDRLYTPINRLLRTPIDDAGGDEGAGRVHPALIDEVQGGPNATYTATAIHDTDIIVVTAEPMNRILPVDLVDWVAAAVGDTCLIVESVDDKGEDELRIIVFEDLDHIFCTPVP